MNDVLKPDGVSKGDDAYDGFRHGVYGMYKPRNKPKNIRNMEEMQSIQDPFGRALYKYKLSREAAAKARQQEGYSNKKAPWMYGLPEGR